MTASGMHLRPAVADDLSFVMRTERGEGFETLLGQWREAQHRREMADPRSSYLIGETCAGPVGFVMLQQLDDPAGNVLLHRIAVIQPGIGLGAPLLAAATDRVFDRPRSHRLWLQVFPENERARRAYRRAGFIEEGVLRESHLRPDGTRVSTVVMSILRSEWESRTARR
jgi:diamine N-acetyltransferase